MSDILRMAERLWVPPDSTRHGFDTRAIAELEVRGDGDGRTVYGLAVPFDEPGWVMDRDSPVPYQETWRMGAFAQTIAERGDRVKFLKHHNKQSDPIGRATMLREDPAGLVAEFRVSKTQAGDETLELVRDGVLDGLSIGFVNVEDGWRVTERDSDGAPTAIDRVRAKLMETSVVTWATFASAMIAGVRTAVPDQDGDQPDQQVSPDQRPDPTRARRRRMALHLKGLPV